MELDKDYSELFQQAVAEIRTAKNTIARQVNVAAMGVYWNLGKLLFEKKIEKGHGAGVVNRLSLDLKSEFPDMGLSPRNLWDMKRFYDQYKNADPKLRQLVAVLSCPSVVRCLPQADCAIPFAQISNIGFLGGEKNLSLNDKSKIKTNGIISSNSQK